MIFWGGIMESIIKKVSVKHGEELKGRVLKVSSKMGSFETPNKAPTSTEINKKKILHLMDNF